MLQEKMVKQLCMSNKWFTQKELSAHLQGAQKKNQSLEEYIIGENIISEDKLYQAAAETFKLPFIDLRGCELKKDLINLIPPKVAEKHKFIVFDKTQNEIKVATNNPKDIQTLGFLQKAIGKKIRIFYAGPRAFNECLHRFEVAVSEEKDIKNISVLQDQVASGAVSDEDLKKAAQDLPIINIVNNILEQAVYAGTSDIHIEPDQEALTVRYRIDGVLHAIMRLPKALINGVIARVKVLSQLRLDEHMLPQDGRFKIKVGDQEFSFRVSITPVMGGEKIVMRLLQESTKPLTLDELGLQAGPRKIIERNMTKPHGMILVTGPTGSGKTTTLYSVLNILNKPSVNIVTVEDPIEYHISGINQSQINPKAGFDFATALRAFLRQDPDIMMVGEIRDKETAEIAVHSAMTGHLVLSTLHTNDAPTTLPRLTDMGVPSFLVSFTVNVIVAQRLVRKLCPHCKKEVALDPKLFEEIGRTLSTNQLFELYKKYKLLGKNEKTARSLKFFKAVGCHKCGDTGYKGRIGVYEVMDVTENLREIINRHATAEQIKNEAIKEGMLTIAEDGLLKAKAGVTSLEEVFRVTKD